MNKYAFYKSKMRKNVWSKPLAVYYIRLTLEGRFQPPCVQTTKWETIMDTSIFVFDYQQGSQLTVNDVYLLPQNSGLCVQCYIFNQLICLYVDCSKANTF